jgi:hypothetical protein
MTNKHSQEQQAAAYLLYAAQMFVRESDGTRRDLTKLVVFTANDIRRGVYSWRNGLRAN